ncbi:HDOD domain-containing protein [bacterium]|nr:HDOD domain-containing protein [bacterium]
MIDCLSGKTVRLKYYSVDTGSHMFINALLTKILAHYSLTFFVHPLETIVHELLSNAYKANLKRVYFADKHLDLENATQFRKGIREFRATAYADLGYIHRELRKRDLYFELSIVKKDKTLCITVMNNSPLSPAEQKRISDRFSKVNEYDTFLAAYDDFFDESEGAGLGIIMAWFLLKDSGVDPTGLTIDSRDGVTEASICLPLDLKPAGPEHDTADHILREIEQLPPIPARITAIIEACDRSDITADALSSMISADPDVADDLLRLARSADLGRGVEFSRIEEAVRTVGKEELKLLALAIGVKRILQKRYRAFRQVWRHCKKTACFASVLARELGRDDISDYVYLGSLLHDQGKIVLLSLSDDINEKIADIASNRHIRESTIIEEVAIGISHVTIGEIMAEKWDFPEHLKLMISSHHRPFKVEEPYRDMVLLTHLADIFWGIGEGRYDYSHIEEGVLERFGIENEARVIELIECCSRRFNECPNLHL